MSDGIKDQERMLISMVLWMLEREVLKLRGLQQITDNHDRWLGLQDAIDLLTESIETGMSIQEADIERVMKEVRAQHKKRGN